MVFFKIFENRNLNNLEKEVNAFSPTVIVVDTRLTAVTTLELKEETFPAEKEGDPPVVQQIQVPVIMYVMCLICQPKPQMPQAPQGPPSQAPPGFL